MADAPAPAPAPAGAAAPAGGAAAPPAPAPGAAAANAQAAALAVADGAADAAAGDAAEDDGPPDDAGSSSDRDDEGDGGGVALDTAVKAGVVRIAAASKKVGDTKDAFARLLVETKAAFLVSFPKPEDMTAAKNAIARVYYAQLQWDEPSIDDFTVYAKSKKLTPLQKRVREEAQRDGRRKKDMRRFRESFAVSSRRRPRVALLPPPRAHTRRVRAVR